MRTRLVLSFLVVGMLCVFGVSAQPQMPSLPSAVSTKSSIEEPTRALQLRKEDVIPQGTLVRVAIAVILGLALAIAVAYLLKKYLFARNLMGSNNQRMQLLEVRRLSPRLILFMVRIDDKTMVLAQSGERVVALDPAMTFENRQDVIDDKA